MSKLNSFYHPHDPAKTGFTNTDPATGEVYPSMTKQEFMPECDINNILTEFKVTGQIRHLAVNAAAGVYTDLSNAPDFQTALNTVVAGEAAFATLPSKLRARFNNDPGEFLAFMDDPANQDEAIRLGLATDNRPPASPAAVQTPETPPEGEK